MVKYKFCKKVIMLLNEIINWKIGFSGIVLSAIFKNDLYYLGKWVVTRIVDENFQSTELISVKLYLNNYFCINFDRTLCISFKVGL